jgi:hypothetical protein
MGQLHVRSEIPVRLDVTRAQNNPMYQPPPGHVTASKAQATWRPMEQLLRATGRVGGSGPSLASRLRLPPACLIAYSYDPLRSDRRKWMIIFAS